MSRHFGPWGQSWLQPCGVVVAELRLSKLHILHLYRKTGTMSRPTPALYRTTNAASYTDLARVNVEILSQLDHGRLALDRSYCHFRLERRAVIPAWSSCLGLLLARSIMPPLLGQSTYPGCADFRGYLSR